MSDKFDRYVCDGDTVTREVDGMTYKATIEYDDTSRPEDYECYSEKDIERWHNNNWFFGGIVLSAKKGNVLIDKHIASLWGLECNIGKDNTYLDSIVDELIADVHDTVKDRIKIMIETLQA